VIDEERCPDCGSDKEYVEFDSDREGIVGFARCSACGETTVEGSQVWAEWLKGQRPWQEA